MLQRTTEEPTGISSDVITAVAGAAETDPLDLPALYETVDSDALDALAASMDDTAAVEFQYASHTVTVTGDDVTVTPVE